MGNEGSSGSAGVEIGVVLLSLRFLPPLNRDGLLPNTDDVEGGSGMVRYGGCRNVCVLGHQLARQCYSVDPGVLDTRDNLCNTPFREFMCGPTLYSSACRYSTSCVVPLC